MEYWKNIIIGGVDYTNLYSISNIGRVRNDFTNKIYNLHPNSRGYIIVSIKKNGIKKSYQVHRLVATAFIQNPQNKLQVNHKNKNKKDNNIGNLEWCTPSENIIHSFIGRDKIIRKSNVIRIHKFGDNPNAKKIINIKTGVIYGSASEVADVAGFTKRAFTKRLSGELKNNTDFSYLN